MKSVHLRAFIATIFAICYIITISGVLAFFGSYGEAMNSLCSVAVGGLIGYMVSPRKSGEGDK